MTRLPQTPYDTVLVSGGFDPAHIGHIRMILESATIGNRRLKPTYFANGGDRKTDNTPEMDVCKELGVKLLWNVGGGKIQSSSDLVSASGMVMNTESSDPDLPTPTSVEVVTSKKA